MNIHTVQSQFLFQPVSRSPTMQEPHKVLHEADLGESEPGRKNTWKRYLGAPKPHLLLFEYSPVHIQSGFFCIIDAHLMSSNASDWRGNLSSFVG